jgi:pyruvate/2-oxoglutarate dehydrogenase complex dihydrolipoamide dehydrogenase (E3) component
MADIRTLKADLCVIGAGSGGLSAAAGAAMLGLKVVLFEKHEMGGDCLNYGCVPSKALLSAAKAAHAPAESAKFGVTLAPANIDWDGVKAHVRKTIETIAPVDSQERFEGLGCTVVREAARFADRDTIVSDSVRVKARRIIVATGSRAFIPPIPGLADLPYLTNETIFSLPAFPQHLVVLGGGPIGLELAQAFARLGAKVTVFEMGRALARADEAHAAIAVEALRGEGVTILEGHKVTRVGGDPGRITVHADGPQGETSVQGTHVLVALGRRAVLDGLDLDKGGVTHTPAGITVGDTLRSRSNPRVWALGDAAGREQFTHVAGWHASMFIRRAFFKQGSTAASLPVPAVTYTSPEIAQVGLTETEARAKFGAAVKTSAFPFHDNDRAIAEGKTLGGAKLVIHKGRLVGASIAGDGAGDILQLVCLAMSNRMKLTALTNFISPYPTRAEVVKRAASAYFSPTLFARPSRTLVGLLQRIP